MSFYGLVGAVVYMLPSSTASYNQKIVIVAFVLLTMPFTLLVGWLVTRRSKGKDEKAAAASAAAPIGMSAPAEAASESGNGTASQPAKLTTPAGSYTDISTGAEEVVQFLKGSGLGGAAKEAVYSLPWYLVAGAPKAGKSALVIGSDLNFENLPSQRQSELRMIRPTRSVDWRVTSDAVFVDTAGRYQTEGPDADEWASLLETIRKQRSNRPLDGMILTVTRTIYSAATNAR
jgi:Uncharacterized protein conserved in bacteria